MTTSKSVIPPGSTIGVLGSGQLGRMFAIAARQMGYRVHTLSPAGDTPTGQVADVEINAAYDDLEQVERFASNVDVVTFEFENVPAATTAEVERHCPVRPGGELLHISQNRLREKSTLQQWGFPVTPFREVHSPDELNAAVQELGTPAILKTAAWGYDGKGQARIDDPRETEDAWRALNTDHAILEAFIDFECEASVIVARGLDETVADFGVIRNDHAGHILDISTAPADLDERTEADARDIARQLAGKLDLVGVLCIEFFVAGDGSVMINEIAPRPHNSGHLTIDACQTSQFQQQVRAVCGLPLGSTELIRAAAMANLLGDLWAAGEPRWAEALRLPNVNLHLYGKLQPRPCRKMGHLTALADDVETARRCVIEARQALIQPETVDAER